MRLTLAPFLPSLVALACVSGSAAAPFSSHSYDGLGFWNGYTTFRGTFGSIGQYVSSLCSLPSDTALETLKSVLHAYTFPIRTGDFTLKFDELNYKGIYGPPITQTLKAAVYKLMVWEGIYPAMDKFVVKIFENDGEKIGDSEMDALKDVGQYVAHGIVDDSLERPRWALVMLKAPGDEVLDKYRKLPAAEKKKFKEMVIPKMAALAWGFAKDLGWYHNDLKPNNAFINAAGVVTLVDWGSACRSGQEKCAFPESEKEIVDTIQTLWDE